MSMEEQTEERIFYKSNDIKLTIDTHIMGLGSLILSESKFFWKPYDKDYNISLNWKEISLHAIQSDPRKCIYVMLDFILEYPDKTINGQNDLGLDNSENGSEDSECEITELWLEPIDLSAIADIFATMKHCQSLHPDSVDDDEAAFDDFENNFDDNNGIDEDLTNLNLNGTDNKFADAFE